MGPLVTLGMCQLVIWGVQRAMVRPSLLISRWAGFVLEVVCELEGVLESEGGAVDLVDASHGFLRVPGCAHFAVGVTSVEESAQAGLAAVADLVVGGGEEPPYPIEWVWFPASVSEGFVLDSSAYFVESLVG